MRRAEPATLTAAGRAWVLAATGACLLPLLPRLPGLLAAVTVAVALATACLSRGAPLRAWLRTLLALGLVAAVLAIYRFGLGRDVACALLAAMLALKPAELGSMRDARSLVGFALFAPFATFLLDQGPLSLLLGMAGAIVALGALHQLADDESGDLAPVAPARRLGAVLRLAAIGLPLTLAAFWLFPRIPSPLWGVPDRVLSLPGLSDEMEPGQWLDMMNDERPALRVSFQGEAPPPSQMYWRGPVLLDFDGRTWRRARDTRALPPAAATPAGPAWDYLVEIEPTERATVVALELPQATPAGTTQSWDLVLEAPAPLTSVTRWRMQARRPASFEPELPEALRRRALQLPPGYNPRTVALARQWRADNGPGNDAAIVERAMRMIRAEFGYTLSTPLPGRHSADEFLFDWKQGFCEHFSSAFAVMLRAAGLPARVVTGYQGGTINRFDGTLVVRQSDAHAWVEVWLDGRGWVRVDPTALAAPARIERGLFDALPADEARPFLMRGGFAVELLRGLRDRWEALSNAWNRNVVGFDRLRQRGLLERLGLDADDPTVPGLLLVAGLALPMLALVAWAMRQRVRRDALDRAWRAFCARLARRGLARLPSEGPIDYAERVARALPASAPEVRRIAALYAALRYGASPSDTDARLRELTRSIRFFRPR